MPRVAGFRGIHYSPARFASATADDRVRTPEDGDVPPVSMADLSDVVCPPYDVIDDSMRRALLARHPENAVRLEYAGDDDPHAAAATRLIDWLASGTLVRRSEPAAYYYRHGTTQRPDELMVEGVVTRVLLEPWGGGVRPHERTLPGPKADRLGLLRATRTQLSPILAVYFDRSARYHRVMSRAWTEEWRARDADGLLHQLAAVGPDDRLLGYLGRQTLFVADGHHRYETALAFQAEVRAEPPYSAAPAGSLGCDWIAMALVNAELADLDIRPTHRVVVDADAESIRSILADERFDATPMPMEELPAALDDRRDRPEPVFGLAVRGGDGFLLVGDGARLRHRLSTEPMSTAVSRLDLTALHVALLGDRLGIGPDEVAAGRRLAYTRDAADALARVRRGDAAAAFLVRATRIEQLADVATAGDVMPQKSTYFYPKLLTGMVFNPLED
jgi:uncharacterized protein (DUF1015 family)